ncbi:MAG TPA: hypothetical protein VHY09_13365 [Candidatus Methylacidiphilales bacterium]|jgi:hypothetical protein|nr:hypothetical protein [Candidatus Methylacidiphilales bacterium]
MGEKPTPEIEAQGLKAYEQARAFERIRAWRLPVAYTMPSVAFMALGAAAWLTHHLFLSAACFGLAPLVAVRMWFEWRRLWRLYEDNLALLARLEEAYGDALPWVQVEHHFAALEDLKRKIAADKDQGQSGG